LHIVEVILFFERFESYFINLHGIVLWWNCQGLGWHKMQTSFVLVMVPNIFFCQHSKICYHIKQLVQWLDLMLKGLTSWTLSPSCHYVIQVEIDSWVQFCPMECHNKTISILMDKLWANVILGEKIATCWWMCVFCLSL
jgi:hypothetical protein